MPRKISGKQKALKLAAYLVSKQANNVVILEVSGISSLCDYCVICSADSGRQVQAMADELVKDFSRDGLQAHHYQRDESSRWLLIDFFDVILHIFLEDVR